MNKRIVTTVFYLSFAVLFSACEAISSLDVKINDLLLRYDQPASVWEEALPLGNGSFGAMVMGCIHSERIYLNESSVWAGQYHFNKNEEMPKNIGEIRKALFEGDHARAEELIQKYCTKKNDPHYGSYQPLGDLYLSFTNLRDSITDYNITVSDMAKRVECFFKIACTLQYHSKLTKL